MAILNDMETDTETNTLVKVNDLSKGKYDVTCSAGPSFQNRQQEAITGMIDAAKANPMILEIAGDVFMNNMTFPGAEQIGERLRAQLFDAGMIPIDQMTDEEKAEMQAEMEARQAQGQTASPEQMIGQAELIKAENEQDKTKVSVAEKQANIKLAIMKERREEFKARQSAGNDQAKLALSTHEAQFSSMMSAQRLQMDKLNDTLQSVKTMAEAMKIIQGAAAEFDIAMLGA